MTGFQHDIAGGNGNLVIAALQSPDFAHGSAGWQVRKDGSAEFNDLDIRGTFNGTDFIINNAGAFFYSAAPALGNLLVSIAGTAGTDVFGNPYSSGTGVYGAGGSSIRTALSGGSPFVAFKPQDLAHAGLVPQLYAVALNPGLVNEQQLLVIYSGVEIGHQGAVQVTMISEANDGTAPADFQVTYEQNGFTTLAWRIFNSQVITGFTLAASHPFAPGTAETWQTITLDAGWTAAAQAPQYRLLPDGNVQVRGSATHAGTTAGTDINNSNPVPASYQPAQTRYYRPPQAGDAAGSVQISSTGVFAMRGSGFTATQAILDGIYSL